jgi:hypothetical protein
VDFAQFLLTHQGMVENLIGIMAASVIGFAFIGVPAIIRHTGRELDEKCGGDPMFGTFFAKDPRHRPI